MPELPEVETIRRGLEKYVVGHKIESVDEINKGIIQGDTSHILNAKITDVRRIGKGLILDLDNAYSLAIHIKLTGQLIYRDPETEKEPVNPEKVGAIPNKFTHVVFHLSKLEASGQKLEAVLYYNDQRRFGWIKILETSRVMDLPFFKEMGPEPFAKDIGSGQADLTLELFQNIIHRRTTASSPQKMGGWSTPIKQLIMDQTKIGGIGNIYANDALFEAKINPKRPAKSLTEAEISNLYKAIIKVMEKSFKEGGASELSFVNILGQTGNYQSYTLVYGKKGKPCSRNDGGAIERVELGGRGTFFCAICQK